MGTRELNRAKSVLDAIGNGQGGTFFSVRRVGQWAPNDLRGLATYI